eukprot:scaffold9591_cov144-Cylindrotheca_fusiformis.AAC.1
MRHHSSWKQPSTSSENWIDESNDEDEESLQPPRRAPPPSQQENQKKVRLTDSSSTQGSSGMESSSDHSITLIDESKSTEATNRPVEVPPTVAPSRGCEAHKSAGSNGAISPGDNNLVAHPPPPTIAKKANCETNLADSSTSEGNTGHRQEATQRQRAENVGFHRRVPSPGAVRIPGVNGRATDDDSATFFVGNAPSSPDEEAGIVAEEVPPDGSTEMFRVAYNEGAADALEGNQKSDIEVLEAVSDRKKNRRNSYVFCTIIALLLFGGLGWYLSSRGDSSSKEQFEATSPPTASSNGLPPLVVSEQFPLSLCQGDCDSDVDCRNGLQCFQRNGGTDVPGCSGGRWDNSATDYCIAKTYLDPALQISSNRPLGRCEGDCDFNTDCEDGLICFQRIGNEEVPGCFGGADDSSNTDYCIKPGQFIERFGERLVGSPDDNFGAAVSLSSDGSIMAVGAVDIGSTGYVSIYKSVEESSWQLVTTIRGDNPGDRFGHTVELSGDGRTIAVGYVLDLGPDRDCIYPFHSVQIRLLEGVLEASSGERRVWKAVGNVILGNYSGTPIFDYSIGLSNDGQTLAMGQARYTGQFETMTFYQNEGDKWRLIQSPDPELRLSSTVSMSRTSENPRIAVSNPGYVRIFELSNSTWLQIGRIIWEHDLGVVAISGDGSTIALTDTTVLFPSYNDCMGVPEELVQIVRIYKYDPANDWSELGEPIIVDARITAPEVSLSNDGGAIAIGEPDHEGVGRVRLYRYFNVSNEWTLVDERINGQRPNERFGSALSLAGSGDGMTMVVGAPFPPLTLGAPGSVTSYRTRLGEKPPNVVVPTSAPTLIPVAFQNTVIWRGMSSYSEGLVIGNSISLSSDGSIVAYS